MGPQTANVGDSGRLIQLYKDAYQQIINDFLGATDFGKAYRGAILADIRQTLSALGVQTQAWIDQNIPAQYQQGMTDAVNQLDQLGASITVGSSFTVLDKEAVQVLISDTQKSFGNAMSAVNRSAQQIFTQAVKEEIKQRIATGTVTLNDRRRIVSDIKQTIQDQGVSALQDTAGRTWTLDRYADMLSRTKMVEARNTGLQNQMLAEGNDLVQVSAHGATDVCAGWEGVILSLTGQTPGYPTVDDAAAGGLWHPNCLHLINAISPELAARTQAYGDTGQLTNVTDQTLYEQGAIR